MDLRSATWVDGLATFSHAPMSVTPGGEVTVADVDPVGYNGTFEVVACSSLSCVVEIAADPGTYISGGTIE